MILRMLWGSFRHGRRRKLLAGGTIALAASLITTLLNLTVDVGDRMAQELRSYGSNIEVVPISENIPVVVQGVDVDPLGDRDFLEEADVPRIKDIFWRNNVIGFTPFLEAGALLPAAGDRPVTVIGTWFDKPVPLDDAPDHSTGVSDTHGFWQVAGAWPEDARADQVLVGRRLAAELGVEAGDRLALDGAAAPLRREVTVVGLLGAGGAHDRAIVAPLALAQALAGLPGKVGSISVSALTVPENELSSTARRDPDSLDSLEYDVWYCSAYVSSIAHQIEEVVRNAAARPVWQVAASEGVVVDRIKFFMMVVTLVAIVASGMSVSSLMSEGIMERSREIGLMKALGARSDRITLLFLLDAAAIGAAAGLVGCLLGFGQSYLIGLAVFGAGLSVHPIVIPVVVVLSALIALIGSVVPSRLISRLQPIEVLYGRR